MHVAKGQEQNTVIDTFPQNLRTGAGESTPLSQGRSSAVSWGRVWGYGENPNPRCLRFVFPRLRTTPLKTQILPLILGSRFRCKEHFPLCPPFLCALTLSLYLLALAGGVEALVKSRGERRSFQLLLSGICSELRLLGQHGWW